MYSFKEYLNNKNSNLLVDLFVENLLLDFIPVILEAYDGNKTWADILKSLLASQKQGNKQFQILLGLIDRSKNFNQIFDDYAKDFHGVHNKEDQVDTTSPFNKGDKSEKAKDVVMQVPEAQKEFLGFALRLLSGAAGRSITVNTPQGTEVLSDALSRITSQIPMAGNMEEPYGQATGAVAGAKPKPKTGFFGNLFKPKPAPPVVRPR